MPLPWLDLCLALLAQAPPVFTEVSGPAGIAEETTSFSIAAADLDADFRTDLVISRHGGRPRVWKNHGGTFTDLASAQGFLIDDCHGITIADLEPDYFPEIYVSVGACRGSCAKANHYYLNRFGRFFLATGSILDDPLGRGRSMTPFDTNGDRRLDLFVCNFNSGGTSQSRYFLNDPLSPQRYTDVAPANGIHQHLTTSLSVLDLHDDGRRFALYDGPGSDAGRIFEVSSSGALTEVTSQLGLRIPDRWTVQQIVPFDYDSDGDLDLYVVRGAGGRDFFGVQGSKLVFRSSRTDASFRVVDPGPFVIEVRIDGAPQPQRVFYGGARATRSDGRVSLRASAIASAPLLGATDSGVFVWHELGELRLRALRAGSVVTATVQLARPGASSASGLQTLPSFSNLLYRNDRNTFVDVTAAAGLVDAVDSGSALAEDFDADGDLDLFVVNRGDDFGNTPDFLYLNRDDGTFVEEAAAARLRGANTGRGDGAASFDYDRDGDLDLCVTNGYGDWPNDRGPVQLFRNEANRGNGTSLQLIGLPDNTFGLGARIRIRLPDGRRQYRVRGGISAHMSHGLAPLFVGLGTQGSAAIDVTFPSGVTRSAVLRPGALRLVFE
jgi:hypothetical protein